MTTTSPCGPRAPLPFRRSRREIGRSPPGFAAAWFQRDTSGSTWITAPIKGLPCATRYLMTRPGSAAHLNWDTAMATRRRPSAAGGHLQQHGQCHHDVFSHDVQCRRPSRVYLIGGPNQAGRRRGGLSQWRGSLPRQPGGRRVFSTAATGTAGDDGATFLPFTVPVNRLVAGVNVLAVEMHQAGPHQQRHQHGPHPRGQPGRLRRRRAAVDRWPECDQRRPGSLAG